MNKHLLPSPVIFMCIHLFAPNKIANFANYLKKKRLYVRKQLYIN